MAAALIQEPCVTLKPSIKIFTIESSHTQNLPNWDELSNSTKVYVCSLCQPNDHDVLLDLAVRVKSKPQIRQFSFDDCTIQDFEAFCEAITHHKDQLVALSFLECVLGRSVTETLRLMLTENLLESLSFCSCQIESLELIPQGLRKNQSLKELDLSLMTPNMYLGDLKEMFTNNVRLTTLRISLPNHQAWDLFRAMERSKSLTSLSLASSNITLTSMEAIMMMCVAIPSLQALAFDSDCTFHADALEFMVRMLSNHNNNLISSLQMSYPHEASQGSDVINFGTLNVDTLVFELVDLQPLTLLNMLDTMAHRKPPRIKCLQLLRRVSETMEEDFQIICDHIANDSFGPTELALDIEENDIHILMDALARNTRLKALTMVALEESESVMVAEGVARLRGLRKLAFDDECYFDEAFFVALLASVELNRPL